MPSVRGNKGAPFVFETERDAQLEIADLAVTRLQEFIDGRREFDDATTVEEYVVDVDVMPDGSVVDSEGNCFGSDS